MSNERDRRLALKLDQLINPAGAEPTGFILMTFPVNREGFARYISNVSHGDAVVLLRNQVDSLRDLEAGEARRLS